MSRTIVCVTTFNEAATVGALIERLRAQEHGVIVSDGGSTDGTRERAKSAGAAAIGGEKRLPIREGLVRAFRLALYSEADRIAVIDAGGSHDPADLPRLLEHDADVVIGSRFVPGAHYHGRAWRGTLSRAAGFVCNLCVSGAWVRDWSSGYRVYSRPAVEEILSHRYRASMHAWQMEALAHLVAAGLGIVEAPITYRAGRSSASLKTVYEATLVWSHMLHHLGATA